MWALLLGLCVAAGGAAATSSPALVWSNTEANNLQGVSFSPLQEVSHDELYGNYLSAYPSNIILFLQDALSVEDISSSPEFFEKQKDLIYIPKLENPHQLKESLLNKTYKASDFEALASELSSENRLIVVKLPHASADASRRQAMLQAVNDINGVLSKHVVAHRDFTFIFTGLKSFAEEAASSPVRRVARALLQAEAPSDDPGASYHTPCVLLYLRSNMEYSPSGQTGTFVTLSDATSLGGSCDSTGGSNTLGLKYSGVQLGSEPQDVTVTFEFSRTQGWRAPRVAVAVGGQANTTLLLQGDLAATSIPLGMSYSCSPAFVYRAATEGGADRATLRVNGVQMQAFMTSTEVFGPYWDCVGFFTPGIWMGLLTAALGLVILAYGFMMIATITTMDRFDDPRGKTITVTQEE